MKNFFFIFLLAGIFSCKKQNEIRALKNEMIGTWESVSFSGYPFNQPPLLPGNGRIIVFQEGGVFERRQHDTLLFRGKYSVQRKKDCYPGHSDFLLSTNEGYSGDYRYIEISDGKLSLSTPNCYQDGGTGYYRRLQ